MCLLSEEYKHYDEFWGTSKEVHNVNHSRKRIGLNTLIETPPDDDADGHVCMNVTANLFSRHLQFYM
jgi:hypothetical protein